MKARASPARLLLLAGGALTVLLLAYLYLPKTWPLGNVRVDGATLVPADAVDRLNAHYPGEQPGSWLRIALSSDIEMAARSREIGVSSDLYAAVSPCPFRDVPNIHGSGRLPVRGPFPDDMPRVVPHDETLPANRAKQGERLAVRRPDGRFHYSVYVGADRLGAGGLCLKITGSKFFGSRAEADLTIPASTVRQALRR